MPSPESAPIVVAGDVSIDWLAWPLPVAPEEETPGAQNWRLQEGTRMVARRGGALLLTDLLRHATKRPVTGPEVESIELRGPDEHLHSMVDLTSASQGFRIERLRGFCGPDGCNPEQPGLDGSAENACLLVLDDSGNGFRDSAASWQELLDTARPAHLIVKMSRPLATGPMWEVVRNGPKGADGKHDPDRLIVVINADDLRAEGIALSRRLSWERTAEDFVRQLASNGKLATLVTCAHLIVRFDCDGVIYHRGRSSEPPVLYFDPAHVEGEFVDGCPGRMMGMTAAFTAGLAASLAENREDAIDRGIRRGMAAACRLAKLGFAADKKGRPDYPHKDVFAAETQPIVTRVDIATPKIVAGEEWSILNDLKGDPIAVARSVVTDGPGQSLRHVPVAKFGELLTADRRETESFRAIGNLLREYLAAPQSEPISIGVFGPPGAGKSFGVQQVAVDAAQGRELKVLEFNLSQFTGLADLIAAFHLVRDCALSGKLPLAFFDEFDSAFESKLGWLRYFLSPMQDGEFREAGHAHPIGSAIFVFAGGTASSFARFSAPMDLPEDHQMRLEFAAAKGPDFASRLRGFVDILGPDPVDERDTTYPLRRALLLRSLLTRRERRLLHGETLHIDKGLLDALLTVPAYRHGVRSMKAVLAMSALTGQTQYQRAALPPPAQLNLHVDPDAFAERVKGQRLPDEQREKLGPLLHEAYRKYRLAMEKDEAAKQRLRDGDPSQKDWAELSEELKESNYLQADDIPRKLRKIGCFTAEKIDGRRAARSLTDAEITLLGEEEHERWNSERLQSHWRLGIRDVVGHESPFLVPWCDLKPEWQDLDKNAAAVIPEVLRKIGQYVYRVER